ncbi:AMMECR1 family protein, partial [Candidatus Woesearchaeota archaeon]|nr:AMMECR1 family protein [Candidatus Woesearchaeota archaeon]
MNMQDKKRILQLARDSITLYFEDKKPKFDEEFLREKLGVFVTIKLNDDLRGCIGFPEPIYSLGKAIIEAAQASAFQDPRFPPLEKSELKDIK